MKDVTRKVIIEVVSTVAACAVEFWRRLAKNSERRGDKK